MPCGRRLLAPLTWNKEGSKGLEVHQLGFQPTACIDLDDRTPGGCLVGSAGKIHITQQGVRQRHFTKLFLLLMKK